MVNLSIMKRKSENTVINSDNRSSNIYPSISRIERVLGKDVSDEPIDFRALRHDIRQLEKETIRRRQEIEISRPVVGDVWPELKTTTGPYTSGRNSTMSQSLAYRSLRSLTPDDVDDDSTSFHESFEKAKSG